MGELERARDLQLEIWASLGTEDEAGTGIRRIAADRVVNMRRAERVEELVMPFLADAAP